MINENIINGSNAVIIKYSEKHLSKNRFPCLSGTHQCYLPYSIIRLNRLNKVITTKEYVLRFNVFIEDNNRDITRNDIKFVRKQMKKMMTNESFDDVNKIYSNRLYSEDYYSYEYEFQVAEFLDKLHIDKKLFF